MSLDWLEALFKRGRSSIAAVAGALALTDQQSGTLFHCYTGTIDDDCVVSYPVADTDSSWWFIKNGTSGGHDLIVDWGGDDTISIPPGRMALVFSEGDRLTAGNFSFSSFDPASPGHIGGTTPDEGTFTEVDITSTGLYFSQGIANPTITQRQKTTSGSGRTLSIIAQASKTGSGSNGGKLSLGSGLGDGAGVGGTVEIVDGAFTVGAFSSASNVAAFTFADGPTSAEITFAPKTSGTGAELKLRAQSTSTGTGGKVSIHSGVGSVAPGGIEFLDGASSLGLFRKNVSTEWEMAADVASPAISIKTNSSVNGAYLALLARATGGAVYIDTTSVYFRDSGSLTKITVTPSTPTEGETQIVFGATATNVLITGEARNVPTAWTIYAPSGSGGAAGSNLALSSGDGSGGNGTLYLQVGGSDVLTFTDTEATFSIGGSTLGTMNAAGGYWALNSATSGGFHFNASSASGAWIKMTAGSVSGAIILVSPYMYLQDASGNTAIRIAPVGTGTTEVLFAEPVTAVSLAQQARSTNNACADWTFAPQAPYASATGSNRKGGDLIVDFAAPTNSGTTESKLRVTRAGSRIASLGCYDTALPTCGALWIGDASPTSSNPAFFGDGSTRTYFNAPTGSAMVLSFGCNSVAAGSITISAASGITWSAGTTNAAIGQDQNGSGAGVQMAIYAQDAHAGTATNGGNLVLGSGAKGNVSGANGVIAFKAGASALGAFTDGNSYWNFLSDAGMNGIEIAATANAAGNVLLFSGLSSGSVYMTVGSSVYVRDALQVIALAITPASSGTTTITFAETVTSAAIAHTAKTSDALPHNLSLVAQAAYASATGGNRKPGDLNVLLGAPTNSGASEARLVVKRDGSHAASIGPYEGLGAAFSALYLGPGITPGATNYIFASDGASNNYLNAPSGAGFIYLTFGGTNFVDITKDTILFNSSATGPIHIGAKAQGSDVTAQAVFFQAQDAYSAASSFKDGGAVYIASGAKATGGSNGVIHFRAGATALGTFDDSSDYWQIGSDGALNGLILYSGWSAGSVIIQAGATSGNVYLQAGGQVAFFDNGSNTVIAFVSGTGLSLFNGSSADFGGGSGLIHIHNRTSAPINNPSNGGLLYVESGALKYRGSGGTTTTVAPA